MGLHIFVPPLVHSNGRVFTAVLYLHESWTNNHGGCTRIFPPQLQIDGGVENAEGEDLRREAGVETVAGVREAESAEAAAGERGVCEAEAEAGAGEDGSGGDGDKDGGCGHGDAGGRGGDGNRDGRSRIGGEDCIGGTRDENGSGGFGAEDGSAGMRDGDGIGGVGDEQPDSSVPPKAWHIPTAVDAVADVRAPNM
jgi:hypothetical protein